MKFLVIYHAGRVEVMTRAMAMQAELDERFDKEAIEIQDNIFRYLRDARAAEERALQLLALWCRKNGRDDLITKLRLKPYLPVL